MRYYKGVLLAESLADDTVLSQLTITKQESKVELTATHEQPGTWTWYSIRVPEESVALVAESLARALKPRAWYTNLWQDTDYWLIFPGRIFRGRSVDDPAWEKAIEHGLSIGVPYSQLTPLTEVLQTE